MRRDRGASTTGTRSPEETPVGIGIALRMMLEVDGRNARPGHDCA
jgi:hypothetical protein